jgi:hypothetical protein
VKPRRASRYNPLLATLVGLNVQGTPWHAPVRRDGVMRCMGWGARRLE